MERIVSLNRFAEDILREKNVDSLLEKAISRVTALMEAERTTVYFFNEETKELWNYVATDLEVDEIRVPLGKGIAGKSASLRKVINVKDAYKCNFFKREIDQKTGFYTKTVLCYPLVGSKNKLLGVIQVLNKKKGSFNKQDEEIIKGVSFYLNIALENIKLYQDNETLFRSTLYALAGAIDAKDPVTAGHSHRVAYFSVKTAKELGYPEEDIKILEYAAYLHDIGKIGISDSVLQKKKKLTPQEYNKIKKHPLVTLQILRNIIFPEEIKDIPLIAAHHHEFLDGSGYPFKVKGSKINIFSRIITVVDIYDALTSFDRPYKKPFSVNEAIKILKEEVRKKHLDKKIVDTFIKKELYKYERRRYKRIDLNTSISYQVIPQRRVFKENIKEKRKVSPYDLDMLRYKKANDKSIDVSEGGVLLLTRQYLPVGTFLDLEIEFYSKKIKAIGKIVWVEKVFGTSNYKAGIVFINLSSGIKKTIGKVIKYNHGNTELKKHGKY